MKVDFVQGGSDAPEEKEENNFLVRRGLVRW